MDEDELEQMDRDDEHAALAHQQCCEQQEWESLQSNDPQYLEWAQRLDAEARMEDEANGRDS